MKRTRHLWDEANIVLLQESIIITMEKRLNRIKIMFVEKGISQTELVEDFWEIFSTVIAYCSNRQKTSLELFYQIADYLKVNVKKLNCMQQIEIQ